MEIENWKTQIRKGYLELCVLSIIEEKKRIYGFELIQVMNELGIPVKEGTLYPLLNRMTLEGTLGSTWETDGNKGHPRKFYSLTKEGRRIAEDMKTEFDRMVGIFNNIGDRK
ncbi:MAG: PadR family transcriptional regulator [Bdellovibrionia bacterium]